MKLFKKHAFIHQDELDSALRDAKNEGFEKGEKNAKQRIENLEKALERKDKTLEIVDRELNDANIRVEVLEEERDKVREVVKQSMENEDTAAVLAATKEAQDRREAKLKERANRLDEEEAGEYKKGYADGVADGVRKISEITQADRDNAMKIAMVSAASHTPVANMKEINNDLQLTAGSTDKEA